MAKLAYSKLGIKPSQQIEIINFNEQSVEVKKYLPMNEKLKVVENVLNFSAEDKRFYNVGKIHVYLSLEILFNYTNLSFTEKQKEDPSKLYDNVETSGLLTAVKDVIPSSELEFLSYLVDKTVKSVYRYSNSAMGILDTISQDYSALDLDATAIQSKLADPENMTLLKDVLSKLG